MASVHLALFSGDAGFRKLVALKRPKPDLSHDPEFLEMFMSEARLAARLNHPNVVQTYEVGRHDAEPFIAMEFLEGQPLHRLQRIVSSGVPLAIHLRIISEALAGLHHAHELRDFSGAPLSVVHRDVSPQNVLVGYDGQTKVVDFGIAKAATHASFTELGVVKGKLPYMSPEQTMGEALDRRADLFAIGVMLWEAGAGKRLWPGEPARSRLRMLSLGEIPPFGPVVNEACAELERICRKALEYSPARRYQTAAELESDLEALRREPALHATRRDVVDFMSAHFDAHRRRTQQLIEAELGHFSLNDVASPVASDPEINPKTRRVSAPPRIAADFVDESASSIAPAMSTLSGKAPIRRRRYLLGVAGAGVAVALFLPLIRSHGSLGGSVSHAASALGSAALGSGGPLSNVASVASAASVAALRVPLSTSAPAVPSASPSASAPAVPSASPSASAPAVPSTSPSASAAALAKKPSKLRKAGSALGAVNVAEPRAAATDELVSPAPAAPVAIEAGMDMSRDPLRNRRVTHELDTSDPWAHRK